MSDPKSRENFCPIPFMQLQLNPRGKVSACCFSAEHEVGDIQKESLADIWNSSEMQKWRQEFITGDIQICKSAMKNFECHKMYTHLNKDVSLEIIQPNWPRRLDLRLNGKCNLECIMCDVWRQPNGLYDSSQLWSAGPTEIFPHLVEVDMLGGEPFIQRDTFRFIDEVAAVNSTCTWGFITNGSYAFNEKLRSTLDKIKLRHIHISVDGVTKAVYEKIRKNGTFEKTMATIQSFVAYKKQRDLEGRGFVLFASMCVQKDNWHEIGLFLDFCEAHNLRPILQSIIGIGSLSLQELQEFDFNRILEILTPYLETEQRYVVLPVYQEIQRLKKSV